MPRQTAILVALGLYLVAVLVLGFVAKARTRDAQGYYLGGRSLGPWVAALAANASSSSAWSLVGVSGFAYLYGLSALWIVPGSVGGFVLNWMLVAPRLRDRSGDAVTLTEYLAGPAGARGRTAVVVVASLLTLGCLLTYVAAQMQAASGAFQHAFGIAPGYGIAIGAGITVLYTLLGGYLAVSLTDTVQGALMVLIAVVLPIAAVAHLGGPGAFADAVAAVDAAGYRSAFGTRDGLAAAGFALALCGIGLGYPGQPHAVNKFMGMAPGASMAVARTVGIGWAVLLYAGMITAGWAARALVPPLAAGQHELALYELSQALLPPVVDGLVLAAVLAAVMSTVDSQLLVCASCITHDLGFGRGGERAMLRAARVTVLAIGAGALVAALAVDATVFDHVLFAWAALGSAFGPLLLVRLLRGPVSPPWSLAAMAVGGGLAIAGFYLPPLLAKGLTDRVVSWLAAFAIAFAGTRRR
ncbi:MAG: sodium/proline symporter [Planctomycetota bacterium]